MHRKKKDVFSSEKENNIGTEREILLWEEI